MTRTLALLVAIAFCGSAAAVPTLPSAVPVPAVQADKSAGKPKPAKKKAAKKKVAKKKAAPKTQ